MIGRLGLYQRLPSGVLVPLAFARNTQLVTAGFAIAKTLGMGDMSYKISRIYVEYENVAAPANNVSVPSFDNTAGRTYYANLSSPKDYLRLPLLGAPTLGIATGYESYFTDGVDGNKLTFLTQTAGTVGENGVTFSNALNSKVYGMALAAAPDADDETQDVLVARGYFAVADQQLKPSVGQVVASWELDLTPN